MSNNHVLADSKTKQPTKFSSRQNPGLNWLNKTEPDEWTQKLKSVEEIARKELSINVLSVKLVKQFSQSKKNDAIFALDSNKGPLFCLLYRNGKYTLYWES